MPRMTDPSELERVAPRPEPKAPAVEQPAAEPDSLVAAAPDGGALAAVLRSADSGSRARAAAELQRGVGNAGLQRLIAGDGDPAGTEAPPIVHEVLGSGGGAALEPEIRRSVEPRFGRDFGDVRVHTDDRAAASAKAVDAQAYTAGSDIVFGAGKYAPGSGEGDHLLAHELAHVVQQGGQRPAGEPLVVGPAQDGYEHEADKAAAAVVGGMPASPGSAPQRISRFAQGRERPPAGESGGHAGMTAQALTHMGLNQEQAHQGRLGNWERDLSQAITPGFAAILKAENIFAILNILAILDFGRGLDASEFGTYDPVEHMDNPTDLRASDVFQQTDQVSSSYGPESPAEERNLTPGQPDVSNRPGQASGSDSEAYADVDPRYLGTQTHGDVMNPSDAHAYRVDESGIPVYMNTSKEWLKRTLRGSAQLGREGEGARGPREFASGIHVMQDYYAHSNFCEIAINLMIRDGHVQILTPAGVQSIGGDQGLDTQVHGNDPAGNPLGQNLTFNGREVMTTGSFNLTDSVASLLEEAKDKIVELNPFADKQRPSPLANAALDYIDMTNPTDFSATGHRLADLIRPVSRTISTLGGFGAGIVEGAGELQGGIVEGASDVLGWGLRGLGWEGGAGAVEGAGHDVAGAITGATGELGRGIRQVTGWLDRYADGLEHHQHILREIYGWLSNVDFLAPLKALIRAVIPIPAIAQQIIAMIEELQKALNDAVEELLAEAWNLVLLGIVASIDRAVDKITEQTNIEGKKNAGAGDSIGDTIARKFGAVGDLYRDGHPVNGIAPDSYTPPSHTQIAKDHGPVGSPTDEDHHHHEGSWLNPLAEQIASDATEAIGQRVAQVWTIVDRGETPSEGDLVQIDQEVELWFAHPEASRQLWEERVRAMLGNAQFGPELLEHLSTVRPASPQPVPTR